MSRVAAGSVARASLEAWLRLRAIEGVGDQTILALVSEWHRPDAILQASNDELIQRGCSSRLAEAIRRGPDPEACRNIDRELTTLQQMKVEVRTILDSSYPARLRMIPDPPPLLYV